MEDAQKVQAAAESLFARYLTAWNARDLEAVAACFAEPAQFVAPAGIVALPDRAATVGFLRGVFAGLDAAGFDRSTVEGIAATPCNDGLAVVDATNVRRLRADGSLLEDIDAHYVMRRDSVGWVFAAAVVCRPGWRAGV